MRNTINLFMEAKMARKRVAMVTCYDASMARIVDGTDIDAILVGDSMGMTMLGYDSTLPVTMDNMVAATKAVVGATTKPFIVADMPFMSYQADFKEGMRNAGRLVSEGGAGAVKVEGATSATCMLIAELVDHGVPVIGHLGMTPQSVNSYGGFKAQGKDVAGASKVIAACELLADAGTPAVVLECVPAELAKHITDTFPFATIGIGAGSGCTGEVQVIHDVLGLSERAPKHASAFVDGAKMIADALVAYDAAVKSREFPGEENSTHIDHQVIEDAESYLDGFYDSFGNALDFIDN